MENKYQVYPHCQKNNKEDKKNKIFQQQSFQLQAYQLKKLGLKQKKEKFRGGGWLYQENKLYYDFLYANQFWFESQQNRRKYKVFNQLSKLIETRTAQQCRSHHQKLQSKYKDNFSQLINHVKRVVKKGLAQKIIDKDFESDMISSEKQKSKINSQQTMIAIVETPYFGWYQNKDENLLLIINYEKIKQFI